MLPEHFVQNVNRGRVGEVFVAEHLAELQSAIALNYSDRTAAHVEGVDAANIRMRIGEPLAGFVPPYVDDPALRGAPAYEITETMAGGIEIKTIWNFLLNTLYPDEEYGSLPFALWSNENRDRPGWLIRIMHPENDYEPGQAIRTVQPHTIVFLLAEYENVFASVVFERVPELFERLKIIAQDEGFGLDHIPCEEEEHLWSNPNIKNHVWYVPITLLQDLATVTMIADQPMIRPNIRINEKILLSDTQSRRYEQLRSLAGDRYIPMDERFRDRFTPLRNQQVFSDVVFNLSVLDTLDETKYPTLAYYKRQKVFQHLRGLMLNILAHPYPVWSERNPRFFTIGKDYLEAWCKERGISGSSMSWQGSLVFLKDCNLVEAFRPVGDEHDHAMMRAISGIRRPGKKNITFWSVPRYTPPIMEAAERIAVIYANNHVKLTQLTKADVIRVRGIERANQLYLDGRRISMQEEYVHDLYLTVLQEAIRRNSYAEPDKIIREVERRMRYELHFRYIDFLAGFTQEDEEELARQELYKNALMKMKARTRQLAAEAGFSYRPVRREDRSRHQLPEEYKKWLII